MEVETLRERATFLHFTFIVYLVFVHDHTMNVVCYVLLCFRC